MFFSKCRDFLFNHLKRDCLMSDNTVQAYRHGLNIFRKFIWEVHSLGVDKIPFEAVTAGMVKEYLRWLTEKRGCAITTRNHRLTVLRQYMKYCSKADIEGRRGQTYDHNLSIRTGTINVRS